MDEQQGGGRGLFFTVYRVLFALLSFGTGLFFTIWGGKLLSLGGSAWYLLAGLAYLLIDVGKFIIFHRPPHAGGEVSAFIAKLLPRLVELFLHL